LDEALRWGLAGLKASLRHPVEPLRPQAGVGDYGDRSIPKHSRMSPLNAENASNIRMYVLAGAVLVRDRSEIRQ
jgi:hypothetical protein